MKKLTTKLNETKHFRAKVGVEFKTGADVINKVESYIA